MLIVWTDTRVISRLILVLADDVPHEKGEQVETNVDRADCAWIASLTGLQDQEVASTAECNTSLFKLPSHMKRMESIRR